ncbi:hypothetical protein MC885_002946 [Smutsia gigantea]|nr:hypothetical protein MC885_002946 [Smutsia gigantea]
MATCWSTATVNDHHCCPGPEEDEARWLFWQLVSAVAHCHNLGIVHWGLQCETILLDVQGFLKLIRELAIPTCLTLDPSLQLLQETPPSTPAITHTLHPCRLQLHHQSGLKNSLLGTFCCSVVYTTLKSKKYTGAQADLWSLGVILYATVTGKLPVKEHQHRHVAPDARGPRLPARPILRVDDRRPKPQALAQCQDLTQGLLQLCPHARLGLQQVALHCCMLPMHTHAPR